MKNYLNLKKRIKYNEAFRNFAYLDSLGNQTIGYGHLIKKNEKKFLKKIFTKKYLLEVFEKDFTKALTDYKKNYKDRCFNENIEGFLIEMIFQLGIKNQKKFVKMLDHINNKNFYMACFEMKNSIWNIQTPKRVNSLIKIVLKKK